MPAEKPIIVASHLSKRYRLGQIGGGTFRDEITAWWHRRNGRDAFDEMAPLDEVVRRIQLEARHGEDFWALRDVSFEINREEVVGVVGSNGAGKSTLLKILCRITAPTSGEARLRGRVGSLLEVGTGFHQDLTGRENIYMNGAILGMKKRAIDSQFDKIVEFSGVRKFIDTPVKRYSSGMRIRLAFSVAAHLDAPILLVDEVLAVGDVPFQQKCLAAMGDIGKSGRTIVFVSHNHSAIKRLCTRCIWLKDGRLVMDGKPDEVIARYLADSGVKPAAPSAPTSAP